MLSSIDFSMSQNRIEKLTEPVMRHRPGPERVPLNSTEARLYPLNLTATPARRSTSKWNLGSKKKIASKPSQPLIDTGPSLASALSVAPACTVAAATAVALDRDLHRSDREADGEPVDRRRRTGRMSLKRGWNPPPPGRSSGHR